MCYYFVLSCFCFFGPQISKYSRSVEFFEGWMSSFDLFSQSLWKEKRSKLTAIVFILVGVKQQPTSVCGRHQCSRPAPRPAGKLLVRGRLLQSGFQRSSVAEGETESTFYYLFCCAVGFVTLTSHNKTLRESITRPQIYTMLHKNRQQIQLNISIKQQIQHPDQSSYISWQW